MNALFFLDGRVVFTANMVSAYWYELRNGTSRGNGESAWMSVWNKTDFQNALRYNVRAVQKIQDIADQVDVVLECRRQEDPNGMRKRIRRGGRYPNSTRMRANKTALQLSTFPVMSNAKRETTISQTPNAISSPSLTSVQITVGKSRRSKPSQQSLPLNSTVNASQLSRRLTCVAIPQDCSIRQQEWIGKTPNLRYTKIC
jgi:hypothetical protein